VTKIDGRSPDAFLTMHPVHVDREPESPLRTDSPWLGGAFAGVALLWAARRAGILSTLLGALPGARFLRLVPPARDEAEQEDEQDSPRQ
jgi:hypothetical protein